MNRREAKKIIKDIAKREGKIEKIIRDEMKEAIAIGYRNAGKQALWIDLFGAGHIPEPEEFIMELSGRIKGEYDVKQMFS